MSDLVTPNLGLTVPTVGSTVDPTWADEINGDLLIIDNQCYSINNPVPSVGFVPNADVNVLNFRLDNVKAIDFQNLSGTLSDDCGLYVVSGNLYYNNASGNPVQITGGSQLAVSASSATWPGHSISSNTTIPSNYQTPTVFVATNTAITASLPSAGAVASGWQLQFFDVTGLCATNHITFKPSGSDTVNGVNGNYYVAQNYGGWKLTSDGVSGWWVIASQQNVVAGPVDFTYPITISGPSGSYTATGGNFSHVVGGSTVTITPTGVFAEFLGAENNTALINLTTSSLAIETAATVGSAEGYFVNAPDAQSFYWRATDGLGDTAEINLVPGNDLLSAIQLSGSVDCANKVSVEGVLNANNNLNVGALATFNGAAQFNKPALFVDSVESQNNLGLSGSLGLNSVASGPGGGYTVLAPNLVAIYTPNGTGDAVTLPAPASKLTGAVYIVKLTANHNTTVTTTDGSTIDGTNGGSPGWVIPGEASVGSGGTTKYGAAWFYCDGANWWVL
jgi:hypothetical protein